MELKSIIWEKASLKILDQTRLPGNIEYIRAKTGRSVFRAIRELKTRGAPLIGVAAAYGVALEAMGTKKGREYRYRLRESLSLLRGARPTAVNLFSSLDRMERIIDDLTLTDGQLEKKIVEEARKIEKEEMRACERVGTYGAELLKDRTTVLTYCNAGWLATPGIGTALGVIYRAIEMGKLIHVYVCETRPLLQGTKLTSFELKRAEIPFTLITDNMIGTVLKEVDVVIVGADRIAKNGDVANKIGTLTVALVARAYRVPFYVAAPLSTFDPERKSGKEIIIEERTPDEVTCFSGIRIAPDSIRVLNPSFDITPSSLVTAIITDKGIVRPPYERSIIRLLKNRKRPF